MQIIVFLLCIVKFFALVESDRHRLNVPRVLLPVFNDFPVNFTLEVTEGGCYQWSTSRSDIVRLIPINENYDRMCSSAVIVQTTTREPTRNTAIVLAEDLNNGSFLRCDVIVDAIHSLYMVTTTRELFIEEAPEAFEVRAYDEQGNEFTTLAGIEFSWAVGNTDKRGSKMDESLPNNVLRFMTFEESPYETPHTVEMLDASGKRGNIVLLEGVKTGAAKVSVKLLHHEYKNVHPVEVDLVVVANLIIIPSDVTMMMYDCFTYKIMQVHQGRLEEIHLASSEYYLAAENSNLIEINNDRGSIYALARGRTKISLHDKNVHEEYGVILPTASVSISDVAYITLTVLPHRSWSLILGQTHEIVVDFYDSRDHKFFIGEGAEVTLETEDQYFERKLTTQNGTYAIVVPIQMGTTIVKATLHGVIDQSGRKIAQTPELTTRAELTIHSPVVVNPQTLALPWDPQSKTKSDVTLKASGGDGSFVWSSRQPSIASVSQSGAIKVLQKGSADVTASMARNPYNRDTAKVHILDPTKLEIIQYNMEAAIGEPIFLHIALYGEMLDGADVKQIPFSDCKDLPFELYIPDGNFVYNETEVAQPVSIACAALAVVSLNTGTSTITVTYNKNGLYLMDNITVSAYDPLVVVHPDSGESVLAVGSSRNVIFKGGPYPWSGKHDGYRREISSENEIVDIMEEHQVTDPDISVFKIVCRELGESTLTFTISNIPLFQTCKMTVATATIRVLCAKPRYIFLQPEFKNSENCPMKQNSNKIMTHSNQVLQLSVIVKDEDGRKLDNITSLNIEWTMKPQTGGEIEIPLGTLEAPFEAFNVQLPGNHYQRITSRLFSETLVLQAKVTGYQKNVLSSLKISPEWPPFPIENERGIMTTPLIEATINIVLVNDTSITPNELKVLNDPNSKYFLQVNQGSGFYEFLLSSEDIADIRYVEPSRTITVVPRRFGTLRITLIDLCLASAPAEAVIQVQQLANLEVEAVHKVEKGKCIAAALKMYDTNGESMVLPFLDALSIKVEIENRFIDVKKAPSSEQGDHPFSEIIYMIHGLEEGETQVTFSSGEGDDEIRSEPFLIQVFPPLKLTPKNLTNLVGTIYQVTVTGGPKGAEIEYSVGNEEICSINRNGILEGKSIGETRIIARAIGFNSKGYRIVYSQDYADIHVTNLEEVKVMVPTTRIKVGATIPVWAFGIPDSLTPLIIGSMKAPLSFSWMSSDLSLLSLHNMYEGTGINMRYQNDVSLRAKANSPGTATIFLNVSTPCHLTTGCTAERIYNAFVKIEIFEELKLCYDDLESESAAVILMAPNSVFKLQTNRDKYGVTSFKILTSGPHSVEAEDTNALTQASKMVTVDKNGVVKSGENYGRTVISITNVEGYSLKQTLTVIIDVKPVHYMMLSLKSNIRTRLGEELNMLPKGMELDYIVEFFDNVGSKFHAADTSFKTFVNRGDLVTFLPESNNLLLGKFLENGKSIIKIYNEKYPNGMFDYVSVIIGDIHFPTKATVSVGDVICFSMPLSSSDGEPGIWQSSASEIVAVDPISGIGKARNAGHAFIKHSLTTHLQDEIEIHVLPVAKITLIQLRGKNITGLEVFSIPLVIRGKDEGIKENNVFSRGLSGCRTQTSFSLTSYPFTCTIQYIPANVHVGVKDFFIAKPRFDIVSGFYYCDVIPVGTPNLISSTTEVRLQVNAVSKDMEGNPVEINYLPLIYIGIKEVVFTNLPTSSMPTAFLEIYGLPYVLEQITIDTPDEITISGQQFISKHLFQYKLSLMHTHDDIQGKKILISNELTKQNISLFIRLPRYEQYAHISGIHWLDYVYFHRYTLGVFIVLFITFFHFWKNKMANVDLNVKNRNIFAEKCPPPLRKSTSPCSPNLNNSSNTTRQRSPSSPLRPFSAFEPVYGDPRSLFTPRRNTTLHTP